MDSGLLRGLLENTLRDITKDDSLQNMVREKILGPMFQAVCKELYPYIYVCVGIMSLVVMLLIIVTVMLIGQFVYAK